MAETLGKATLELEGDLTPLGKSLDKAKRQAETGAKGIGASFKSGIQRSALPATAALGALAVGAVKAVDAASNLGEQISKTTVVFRGSERQVLSWGEQTAGSIGISNRAALEAAGVFGNMLIPMGLAREEAAGMSMRMVELAADMASFNNASPEETLDALRAGLAGETEPLRRFGVFLNEARIKEEALRMGLVKQGDTLDAAAKAQASYSLIMKDTADAQGDFARTSDSLANQQRTLRAEFEDLSAQLGAALLPAATAMTAALIGLAEWTGENEAAVKLLVAAVAALGGSILLANASIKIYESQLLAATRATKGLRLAMALTPWGLAAVAAAGLVSWLIGQGDESDEAAQAMDRLTSALSDYHAAIKAGKQAREDLEGANLRLQGAELAVRRAQENRAQVEREAGKSSREYKEANQAVKQALHEREKAERGAKAATNAFLKEQLTASTLTRRIDSDTTKLANTYRGRYATAVDDARHLSRTLSNAQLAVNVQTAKHGVVAEYAARLRSLGNAAARSSPELAATARTAADLASAWQRVVTLPQAREFVAHFRVITAIEENRASVGRNASGTSNWRGGLTMVGERGPELVSLPRGTEVFSASRTERMLGEGLRPIVVDNRIELDGQVLFRGMRRAETIHGQRNGA